MIQVRVGGVWLAAAAIPFGEVSWSHAERGCKEASFSVALTKGRRHPLLTGRPLVELMNGPVAVWSGLVAEADWGEMRFTAHGMASGAEHFQALDSLGNATATSSIAVDQAVARGWQVTRGDGVPTTAFAASSGANTVGALLDAQADEAGQWWTVRADRVVRMAAAPTTPSWMLVPGVVDLGYADDEYASVILIRYYDSGAGGAAATAVAFDADALAKFGRREYVLDATELGPITQARAEGLGEGVLTKGKARMGWVSPLEVSANELLTPGGARGALTMVESHQLLRIPVQYDDMLALGGQTYIDAVIGEVVVEDGAEVIRIAPLGSVAQTFSEVIEETLNIAKGAAA